ncbi:TonB family protein [Spirulina sp. 06S082]|uniref:TonB family protein n=1 Tax=Spirulina sp. 06S082 TaxID=3110248 RepID=UPI002B220E8C|nr:TonB family protein [Spirulina sp. 06S082]MEA5471319.1 TonB family protein [Spirulina sp. 06S082]
MSLNSFGQALFLQLRHPTTIAAFASVGLHASIGVALPSLPFFSEGGGGDFALPRNVQLVELTPAEFARLPQPYTSPEPEYSFDLPSDPDARLTLPSFDSTATPRPREGDLAARSPSNPRRETRSRPNLPPRPGETNSTPPRPNRSTPNLAAIERTVRRTVGNISRNSPPSRSDRIPTLSGSSSSENGRRREEQLRRDLFDLDNNQNAKLPNSDDILNSLAAAGRGRTGAENLAIPSPATPAPERPLSPQELAVRQQEEANTNRIARLREDYRTNDKNTTDQEARNNQERWIAETNQPQAREQLRTTAMQGAYPKAACINRAQGTAVYGVVVQPNGRRTDVQQIRSAGYRILDQQAIAQVTSGGLASGSAPIPYRVTVRFTYDPNICPTLATPPRPSPSPTPARPTPSATPPRPSPSPTPSPVVSPPSTPLPAPPPDPSVTPAETPEKEEKTFTPPNTEQ